MIKKGLNDEFQKMIDKNKDSYGKGIVESAINIMNNLSDKGKSVEKCWVDEMTYSQNKSH